MPKHESIYILFVNFLVAGTIFLYCWKEKPLVGFSDMIPLLKQLMLSWRAWLFQMEFNYLGIKPSSSILKPPTAGTQHTPSPFFLNNLI